MAIDFYCGSGSPYAWRVWLSLEHKKLPYELRMLSFSAGDTRKPEFVALNPRHQVPVIVDDGFVLYESNAIVEYLDERYPAGAPLLPKEVRDRSIARRAILEIDHHLGQVATQFIRELWRKPEAEWDAKVLTEASDALTAELAIYEDRARRASFFGGDAPNAVDFALYPLLALILRMDKKKPDLALRDRIGAHIGAWMKRVEGLPYFAQTVPPHWK